jgi:F0F1-type ATP synthase alpha subunit
LEISECLTFEGEFYRFVDNNCPGVAKKLAEKKQFDDDLRKELRKVLDEFKEKFIAERDSKISA